jgi:hypothetical protein
MPVVWAEHVIVKGENCKMVGVVLLITIAACIFVTNPRLREKIKGTETYIMGAKNLSEGVLTSTNCGENMDDFTVKVSGCSKGIAFICCLFFGWLGIHRFYAGKIGTGLLYFITLGFLGIGVLIDLFVIGFGKFKDDKGGTLI